MQTYYYEVLNETIFHEKLPNGLDVYILKKKEFHKTFATLTIKYGSIDTTFSINEKIVHTPEGMAHFLEHTVFEGEDGDVMTLFSKQGGMVNAYTGFNRTSYTLAATDCISDNLISLLDFVQSPIFPEQRVEREKGIIEQEIRMYEDDPEWRATFKLLENLFSTHPVKKDIAGTVSSIKTITSEELLNCYRSFYRPDNMVLFVVGDVEPEDIIDLVAKNQWDKELSSSNKVCKEYPVEEKGISREYYTMNFPVNVPKVLVGFKESNPTRRGTQLLRYELSVNVLLELMFGPGSEAYEQMYEVGLIDASFRYECTQEEGFGFYMIRGSTEFPDKVATIIWETITAYKKNPIPEEDAQRVIRKEMGEFFQAMNSPQFIANQFTRYLFNEMDVFDVLPTLEGLSVRELEKVLQESFQEEFKSVLIVKKVQ
ncbi:EF-P 5-aminopentanol modification-associated protein YfmH [Rossellomorea sp. H39__3]